MNRSSLETHDEFQISHTFFPSKILLSLYSEIRLKFNSYTKTNKDYVFLSQVYES
jgi:hypothetical protein